ncbi:MAG: dihydropteridine reductase [Lachnospiraceae bacterium]
MNKNDQEFLVQKIRSQYTEKESTKLDELKALDKKVKKPANVFAYVFGSISAVIMGAGMSLVMTELGETLGMGDAMVPGVIVGVIGLILVLINYPMYKKFLEKRNTRNGLLN